MLYGIKIEICCGSIEDVKTADKYDEIDRMEVNSHLEEGGLSMDHDVFLQVRSLTKKQLMCMVRQKPGDFIYTSEQKQAMLAEAEYYMQHGADGIVFGSLTEDHEIDLPFTKQMIELIHTYHKEAVFHKAFDETPDFSLAAKQLCELQCDRLLTSAHCPDCLQGAKIIGMLEEKYGDRMQILPGGGINASNVVETLKETRCSRFHMSLRAEVPEQKLIDVLEAIRKTHAPSGQHILTGEDEAMFEEDAYEETMETQEDTHEH